MTTTVGVALQPATSNHQVSAISKPLHNCCVKLCARVLNVCAQLILNYLKCFKLLVHTCKILALFFG